MPRSALLCLTLPCYAMPHSALPCLTLPCHASLCPAMPHSALPCLALPCHTSLCPAMPRSALLCLALPCYASLLPASIRLRLTAFIATTAAAAASYVRPALERVVTNRSPLPPRSPALTTSCWCCWCGKRKGVEGSGVLGEKGRGVLLSKEEEAEES
ncbi:unnamed protein product [Closterium sp. Naga37s-1]|nr:unnamed protein product [Closterium sp. Naga37s-1]